MYRKEWRIVRKKRNSVLRQLYINSFPTERFMFDGRMFAMPPIAGGQDPSVDKSIAASGDDGYVRTGDSTISKTGIWVNMGYYETNPDYLSENAWFRWTGVTISDTITASYMRFWVATGYIWGSPELKIYGVKQDNPAAPATYAEYWADPLTNAAVDWDSFNENQWNQSPSLNGIFQELVNNFTIENDAVMLQVRNDHAESGDHDVVCPSWDHATLDPAEVHIEYEIPSARRIFITTIS